MKRITLTSFALISAFVALAFLSFAVNKANDRLFVLEQRSVVHEQVLEHLVEQDLRNQPVIETIVEFMKLLFSAPEQESSI